MTDANTRARCEGEQDNEGREICPGPGVRTYRAKWPGESEWFTMRWCLDCAADARSMGYTVHEITVPVPE